MTAQTDSRAQEMLTSVKCQLLVERRLWVTCTHDRLSKQFASWPVQNRVSDALCSSASLTMIRLSSFISSVKLILIRVRSYNRTASTCRPASSKSCQCDNRKEIYPDLVQEGEMHGPALLLLSNTSEDCSTLAEKRVQRMLTRRSFWENTDMQWNSARDPPSGKLSKQSQGLGLGRRARDRNMRWRMCRSRPPLWLPISLGFRV